jgi:hypothetical protein
MRGFRMTLGVVLLLQSSVAGVGAASDRTAAMAPPDVDRRVLAAGIAGPVVATGVLLDARRHATAGMVAALALPTEAFNRTIQVGDEVPTPTVGWSRAGTNGAFKLRIDPTLLSKDQREKGDRVNLLLIGWNEQSLGQWAMTANVEPVRGQTLRAAKLRLDSPNASNPELRGSKVQPTYCSRTLQSTYDTWTIIGETWPYGAHTGNVTMRVGQTTSVGFASSATGRIGSWSPRGSLDTENSVEDDFNGLSGAFRDYRMQVRYGRYRSTCGYYYEERLFATGGFTSTALDSRDFPTSWNHCAPVVGTWKRTTSDGSSYSLGAGVLISALIGINLGLSTNYSETRTISYFYNGNYKVCGNNDVPSRASRVRSGA